MPMRDVGQTRAYEAERTVTAAAAYGAMTPFEATVLARGLTGRDINLEFRRESVQWHAVADEEDDAIIVYGDSVEPWILVHETAHICAYNHLVESGYGLNFYQAHGTVWRHEYVRLAAEISAQWGRELAAAFDAAGLADRDADGFYVRRGEQLAAAAAKNGQRRDGWILPFTPGSWVYAITPYHLTWTPILAEAKGWVRRPDRWAELRDLTPERHRIVRLGNIWRAST